MSNFDTALLLNMLSNDYDTLTQAINALRNDGYTDDFNLANDYIECRNGTCRLSAKDFHVDKVFRFEGPSDPADEAILYAISSAKLGVKGILVNAYGIYSDKISNELVEKLSIDHNSNV